MNNNSFDGLPDHGDWLSNLSEIDGTPTTTKRRRSPRKVVIQEAHDQHADGLLTRAELENRVLVAMETETRLASLEARVTALEEPAPAPSRFTTVKDKILGVWSPSVGLMKRPVEWAGAKLRRK